jgi:hypothetical protein
MEESKKEVIPVLYSSQRVDEDAPDFYFLFLKGSQDSPNFDFVKIDGYRD